MTVARQQADWDHTAMLLTKIHNAMCSKDQDMVRDPTVFNPFRKSGPRLRLTLKELRAATPARHGGGPLSIGNGMS